MHTTYFSYTKSFSWHISAVKYAHLLYTSDGVCKLHFFPVFSHPLHLKPISHYHTTFTLREKKKTFIANNSCNSLNLSNIYLLCLLYFPNNHLSYNYISTAKAINSSEPSRHLRENIFGAPMYLWYTKLTFSLSLPVVPLYF